MTELYQMKFGWHVLFHLLSGFTKVEVGRSAGCHSSGLTAGERTPTRPKASDRITLGSHSNSAFQPITASCKIVPQAQPPSPAESPGKSFQPITMSCKIVSGKCLHHVAIFNRSNYFILFFCHGFTYDLVHKYEIGFCISYFIHVTWTLLRDTDSKHLTFHILKLF